MNNSTSRIRLLSFFLSEHFTDALRITLSVVVPVILAFVLDFPHSAISIGLGALMISLTDSAGSIEEKRLMSLISVPLFFALSLLAASIWSEPLLLGAVLVVIVFIGSMLAIFGARYYLLGTASIILTIFVLGFKPPDAWAFSLCVLIGTSWYYVISLLQAKLFPFKSARHSIAECLSATGDFLKIKALFYRAEISLEDAQKQLLAGHLRVNEKQEQLRSIVLRDRRTNAGADIRGKALLRVSVEVIDLYEEISAVHFDYLSLRTMFRASGVPELAVNIIDLLSAELFRLAFALNAGGSTPRVEHYVRELDLLKERLQYIIDREEDGKASLLLNLQRNVSAIGDRVEAIREALGDGIDWPDAESIKYEHFVGAKENPRKAILRHINTNSGIFRFSARLTVACLFGYILSLFLPLGSYNYWLILTIVIILRPSFQHTVKRNKQRLSGSLIGIGIGLGLLFIIPSTAVQLAIASLALLGFFALNRINYQVSVVFITIMVILCLDIYTGADGNFVVERLVDTLIGCGIAFAASYVFPVWESGKLNFFMTEVLKANIAYLDKLMLELSGQPDQLTFYKLSRKDAYVSLANLAAAFNGTLAEPSRFSVREKNVFQFQTLNQMLTSVLSSMFGISRYGDAGTPGGRDLHLLGKAKDVLTSALSVLNGEANSIAPGGPEDEWLLQICHEIYFHCRKLSE